MRTSITFKLQPHQMCAHIPKLTNKRVYNNNSSCPTHIAPFIFSHNECDKIYDVRYLCDTRRRTNDKKTPRLFLYFLLEFKMPSRNAESQQTKTHSSSECVIHNSFVIHFDFQKLVSISIIVLFNP